MRFNFPALSRLYLPLLAIVVLLTSFGGYYFFYVKHQEEYHTQRNLRVQNLISNVRWKHILLPLWSLNYRYRDRSFTVLVHGQTGHVVGEAPLSWLKILLAIAAAGAVVATVVAVQGF